MSILSKEVSDTLGWMIRALDHQREETQMDVGRSPELRKAVVLRDALDNGQIEVKERLVPAGLSTT